MTKRTHRKPETYKERRVSYLLPKNFGGSSSSRSKLKLLLFNARSVNGKTTTQNVILDENTNLACITKTWMNTLGWGVGSVYPPGFKQPRLQGELW